MADTQQERKGGRVAISLAWAFVVFTAGYMVARHFVEAGLPSGPSNLWWSWASLLNGVVALPVVVFGILAWRSRRRVAGIVPIVLVAPVILFFGLGGLWGVFYYSSLEESDVSPAPILSVWEKIGCQEGKDDAYISTRVEPPPMERMAECTPYDGGETAYFFQFETDADAIAWVDEGGLDVPEEDNDVFIDGRVVILAKDPITAQKFDELFTPYD